MPAALSQGTRVEVSDLFYATPARLKFLKTDRTEAEANSREVVRRHRVARPICLHAAVGLEKFQPRRRCVKEIADLDPGALRQRGRHDRRFLAAFDRERPRMRLSGNGAW